MKPFVAMRLALRGNIKLNKLARRLGAPKAAVSGHLFWFWASVMEQRADGNITGWDAQEVAYYADWEGEEEAFFAAMVDIGWILQTEDGLRVNDWEEWCGMHAAQSTPDAQREKWREQKKAQRARAKAALVQVSADVRGQSADMSAERRGEDLTSSSSTTLDQPRSVLLEATEEMPAAVRNQEEEVTRATAQVDLPARAEPALSMAVALEIAGGEGVQPNLGVKQRQVLSQLCSKGLTREELSAGIRAARSVSPQPPNMGLVVSKLTLHRKDSEVAAASASDIGGPVRGQTQGSSPRMDAKTAAIARGLQRYASGGDA